MSKTKTCTVCMKEKPLVYFGLMNKEKGNRKSRCKSCLAKLAVEYRANRNPTKESLRYHKNYKLKTRYGVTIDCFDALLKQQEGLCAICRTDNWGKRGPVVDHHHSTHVIRAILCHKCNTALGLFREDPDSMNRAALYLLEHAVKIPTGV